MEKYNKDAESTILGTLEAEQAERRASEARIVKRFEEKCKSLREMVGKEKLSREKQATDLKVFLNVDVPQLVQGLANEVHEREAFEKALMEHVQQEISRCANEIENERKIREDMEEKMLRTMEDLVVKMQKAVTEERENRQKGMETFTSLLNEIGERLNDEAELGDEIEQQKDAKKRAREKQEELVLKEDKIIR